MRKVLNLIIVGVVIGLVLGWFLLQFVWAFASILAFYTFCSIVASLVLWLLWHTIKGAFS